MATYGNHWKIVAKGFFNGVDQTRNVFYFESSDATVAPDAGDIHTWLKTLWTTFLLGAINTAWSMYGVDVEYWTGTSWQLLRQDTINDIAGTDTAANPLPQQSALVLTAKVGVRRVTAKKFIAGLGSNQQVNGVLTSTAVSTFTAMATAWGNGFLVGTVTFDPGTWLKNHTFAPFISTGLDHVLGTMRRRKQGVGI